MKLLTLNGGGGHEEHHVEEDHEDSSAHRDNDDPDETAVRIGEDVEPATAPPDGPCHNGGDECGKEERPRHPQGPVCQRIAQPPVRQWQQESSLHQDDADEGGLGHAQRAVSGRQDDAQSDVDHGLGPEDGSRQLRVAEAPLTDNLRATAQDCTTAAMTSSPMIGTASR